MITPRRSITLAPARNLAAVALLLALGAPIAEAARLVPPPSQSLTHPRNQVAVVEVVAKVAPDRARCRVVEAISGSPAAEPESTFDVRLRVDTFEEATVGQRYLLGYTSLRKNALLRDVIEKDPGGPRAVRLALVDDALFSDTPQMRLLIANARVADSPKPPQLKAVMALLDGDDVRSRRMAIYELFSRDDLLTLVGDAELARVAAHIRSTERSASERDILLKTLLKLPEEQRGVAAASCRAVLEQLEPTFDLTTTNPTLALTASTLLAETGAGDDIALLTPFVGSNNPAVGRAAFEAIEQLDPAGAGKRLSTFLADDSLHPDVRRYLSEHRERNPDLGAPDQGVPSP